VTSDVTKEEIDRYAVAARPPVEAAYSLMARITYIPRQTLLGIHSYGDLNTWINSPMIQDNPLWVELRALGLKELDAHHLMITIQNGCHVFLTYDKDFLSPVRKATIERTHPIRLRRPSEFVSEEGF